MRQPIKQLKRFQDLSSVKCGVEVVFLSQINLFDYRHHLNYDFPFFAWSVERDRKCAARTKRVARNPRGKKRAKSWGLESREIADLFRVTIDEVSERGATRSLAIKIAVVSRENYSSPGL